jgi:O-antigen/teichoic acid export membrane protein
LRSLGLIDAEIQALNVAPSGRAGLREHVRSPAAVDLAALAAGTFSFQGGRLALNLIAAALLGPEAFGTWTLFILLVLYSNFLSLGITNGAGRQVPYLLGAAQAHEAARAEDVTFLCTAISAGMAAAIALAIGPFILESGDATGAMVALFGIAVLLQQFFLLQQVLLRSRFRYRPAALQQVVLGITTIVAGLPLLLKFGLVGLAAGQVVVYVGGLALAGRMLVRQPRPIWDPAIARGLVVVGLPIMLAGLLFVLLTTVDRWLVLTFLGREQLGYYGLVGIAVSGILLLPGIVSQQYYPRMAFAHGAGRGGRELLNLVGQQSRVSVAIVAGGAVLTAAVSVIGIPQFMPAYQQAVLPIVVVLFGLVVYGLGSAYGDLLNVIGAQRRYLAIQSFALVVTVALSLLFLLGGAGIVGVATATTVSMTIYTALLVAVARRLGRRIPPARDGLEPDQRRRGATSGAGDFSDLD